MVGGKISVAVVAPANRLAPESAERVKALASAEFGDCLELSFHPQCFLSSGHFAGSDDERSQALLEVSNDPRFDAVWFARGGYGSCRLDERLFGRMNTVARGKTYLGYSDMGFLLARLTRENIGRPTHGPMPADINRERGAEAVRRALAFLTGGDESGIEKNWRPDRPIFAFNLTVLGSLIGTNAEPDFANAILMIEDVDEHLYRIDRMMFHLTSSENVRQAAGLMLGRISNVPENDPPFSKTERQIVEYWCARSGIPFLGCADIGHDAENKIVPFKGLTKPA